MNQNAGIPQRDPAPASTRSIRPHPLPSCRPRPGKGTDQNDRHCYPWPGHVDGMSGFPAASRIEILLAIHAAIRKRVAKKVTDGFAPGLDHVLLASIPVRSFVAAPFEQARKPPWITPDVRRHLGGILILAALQSHARAPPGAGGKINSSQLSDSGRPRQHLARIDFQLRRAMPERRIIIGDSRISTIAESDQSIFDQCHGFECHFDFREWFSTDFVYNEFRRDLKESGSFRP